MPNAIIGTLVNCLNDLLIEEYGRREWRPHRDPLSELVLTILSQHTSDINSGRAFEKLVERFGNWDQVRDADPLE
ncbi:MAG: hypothetical protein Q7O66_06225, partial [Dehalococcoidia bacterium]|nr:hypothetical protein [Dehalococcoidia bacterium]